MISISSFQGDSKEEEEIKRFTMHINKYHEGFFSLVGLIETHLCMPTRWKKASMMLHNIQINEKETKNSNFDTKNKFE